MTLKNPPPVGPSDRPAAAHYQTFDRTVPATAIAASTGRLVLTAIYLPIGEIVTSISFLSGSTALAGGTHGWGALYDPSLALLGQSTDDVAVTWAASTIKTFTLSSPATTAVAGWHYIGYMVAATTMPTAWSVAGIGAILTPARGGWSTSSLTTTAPNPAAAIASASYPWGYTS